MQPRPMRSGRPQIGPWPMLALVASRTAGPRRGVNVVLRSGQGIGFCQIGTPGPRDGRRAKLSALPSLGTQGLVVFPHGDMRNGVWICAVEQNSLSANPFGPGNEDGEYDSHASGAWRMRDGQGNEAVQWPDGSYAVAGNAGTLPTVNRQAPDAAGQVIPVAVPFTDRKPSAAATFPFSWVQAGTGASLAVSVLGEWTITARTGTVISTSGGLVTIHPSSGVLYVNGQIEATGNVTAGFGTGGQVDLLTHVHTGVVLGSSNTGGPVG